MSDSVVMRLGASGGIVVMVEKNLTTLRSSHSSILVSKRPKNHLERVSLYSQKKTLLDRERDVEEREIMKVNLITLIILKATLVSSCWWKKSEQVVKRRAYPVTKSRNPSRPSLPKPTKGTSF